MYVVVSISTTESSTVGDYGPGDSEAISRSVAQQANIFSIKFPMHIPFWPWVGRRPGGIVKYEALPNTLTVFELQKKFNYRIYVLEWFC